MLAVEDELVHGHGGESTHEKIERLRHKREELLALVRSLDITLTESGYKLEPIPAHISIEPYPKLPPPSALKSGIRINNELSLRGDSFKWTRFNC